MISHISYKTIRSKTVVVPGKIKYFRIPMTESNVKLRNKNPYETSPVDLGCVYF